MSGSDRVLEHPFGRALGGLSEFDLEERLRLRFDVPFTVRFIERDGVPFLQVQNRATYKLMRFADEELFNSSLQRPLERLFDRICRRQEMDQYDNYT